MNILINSGLVNTKKCVEPSSFRNMLIVQNIAMSNPIVLSNRHQLLCIREC